MDALTANSEGKVVGKQYEKLDEQRWTINDYGLIQNVFSGKYLSTANFVNGDIIAVADKYETMFKNSRYDENKNFLWRSTDGDEFMMIGYDNMRRTADVMLQMEDSGPVM